MLNLSYSRCCLDQLRAHASTSDILKLIVMLRSHLTAKVRHHRQLACALIPFQRSLALNV